MDDFSVIAVKSTEVSWTGAGDPQEAPLQGNWALQVWSHYHAGYETDWYGITPRIEEVKQTIFQATFNLECIKRWLNLTEFKLKWLD